MISYYKSTNYLDKFLMAFKKHRAEQFFLKASSPEFHTCALKIGRQRYYQNINKETGEIKEVEISTEAFNDLLDDKVGQVLIFDRYIIPLENGNKANLDVFLKDLQGLKILSCEQEENNYVYYNWFGEDISGELGTSYYNLAMKNHKEQLEK